MPFFSIDKVSEVNSPVLVIHGTHDEVIDFSHGVAIYEKCPKAVPPLWVEVNIFFSIFSYRIKFKYYLTIKFLINNN